MKVQSADMFSQRMLVRMRVHESERPRAAHQGHHAIASRSTTRSSRRASRTRPFIVPALGEAEFDVQVTANLAGALTKFLSRKQLADTLEYRLVGRRRVIERLSAAHSL